MSDSMTPSLQRRFTRSLKMLLAEMENVQGDLHQARVILADSVLRTDCPGPNVPRDTAEFPNNQPSSPGANLEEVTVEEQVEEKEAHSNPPSSSQPFQQEEIKALFSTFPESLKDSLNKTLSEISQVKELMMTHGNELKFMIDQQAQLAEAIKRVNTQLYSQMKLQGGVKSQLIQLKEEVNVCTAGLSKINSELTQLAAEGFPMGKLPAHKNLQSVAQPSLATNASKAGQTPLSILIQSVEETTDTAGMLPFLIEQCYNIISTRRSERLAQKLPREFPRINMSSSTAIALLSLEYVEERLSLWMSLAHLLAKQGTLKDLGLLRETPRS